MFQYAREAADFATKGQLPHLGRILVFFPTKVECRPIQLISLNQAKKITVVFPSSQIGPGGFCVMIGQTNRHPKRDYNFICIDT